MLKLPVGWQLEEEHLGVGGDSVEYEVMRVGCPCGIGAVGRNARVGWVSLSAI